MINQTHLDKAGLKDVCPLILYQMESGVCHQDLNKPKINQQPEIKSPEVNKKPSSHEGDKLCNHSKNNNCCS